MKNNGDERMAFIFIHGLGQDYSSWDKTISYLPECIHASSLDLSFLCHGKEITYNNLYASFKAYCSGISEPLNLCGISLGAILALNYAIEYSDRVNSLVLIAPQYKMPRLLLRVQSLIFYFMPKTAFNKMGFCKNDFTLLTKSMSCLDFSDRVKSISCSSLIICGKNDKANIKAAKELEIKIPHSKLHLIENAGHEVNIDAPEELANTIKCFFQPIDDRRYFCCDIS